MECVVKPASSLCGSFFTHGHLVSQLDAFLLVQQFSGARSPKARGTPWIGQDPAREDITPNAAASSPERRDMSPHFPVNGFHQLISTQH